MVERAPDIPRYITVHLGLPDSKAQNIIVPFSSYIKNTAACGIYPTWHENAIRANVYALMSFALGRIYYGRYKKSGYDFDITSSPEYDLKYELGRASFENINTIVDEVFGSYLSRAGDMKPLDEEAGIVSPWGTVKLAESGYTVYEILQYYYGGDIEIVGKYT